nr:putative chaperone protein dnaJ-related protein [Tanacetum cinerariifolium]
MGPIDITQIATGLSVLAGAVLLKSVMDQNSMMGPGSGSGSGQKCLSCNGTGRVSCMCNRWSDGAALLKSVMDMNPMMGPGSGFGSGQKCLSCNGTGRVSCMCNRWSDGDSGCRTCAGSGRMVCSSCGGLGTGTPLSVRISVRPPNRSD